MVTKVAVGSLIDNLNGLPVTLLDTTTALTALNNTVSLSCNGSTIVSMTVTLGTTVTPPTLQIQGSDDNIHWYSIGSALAGVASKSVNVTVGNILPTYIRATVTVIGVTLGTGYSISLRAM
jgi:hypothetical protein